MQDKKYKIIFIGAGSFRFTIPCILNIMDFASEYYPIDLWLVDIDINSLMLVDTIAKQMISLHERDITVSSTTNRRVALSNADFILISISIGIQKSEWFDIFLPLKFGIPQNTGDTVGPGGIFRGIRTIPVMIQIMRDINELCPEATVLNYTNPQSTIMLSAFQTAPKIQSIGLCHELFHIGSKKFARFLKKCGLDLSDKQKLKILYGGLNHFSWIIKFEQNGNDLYPKLRENAEYAYRTGKYGRPFNYYLLKKFGYYCYVEDRHVAEFIPQYYNYFNHLQKPFGITKLRDVSRVNLERKLVYSGYKLLEKRTSNWIIKLFLRPWEGGEKALMMAKDQEKDIPRHHVCNVINKGIISNLPDNCIVEIPCYFKDKLIHPVKIGALPNSINKDIKIHALNQQKIVDSAICGDPDSLLKALLADPMCQFIEDEEKVEALMWNMLYYERKWLPLFSESIPTYRDLLKLNYFVKKEELISYKHARKTKYVPNELHQAKSWPYVS